MTRRLACAVFTAALIAALTVPLSGAAGSTGFTITVTPSSDIAWDGESVAVDVTGRSAGGAGIGLCNASVDPATPQASREAALRLTEDVGLQHLGAGGLASHQPVLDQLVRGTAQAGLAMGVVGEFLGVIVHRGADGGDDLLATRQGYLVESSIGLARRQSGHEADRGDDRPEPRFEEHAHRLA